MKEIQKQNILVVDDRSENISAISAILRVLNIAIVKARSGNEALSILPNYDFAVILLGVKMSGMSGYETAAVIQQDEKHKNTPIIFVSTVDEDSSNGFEKIQARNIDFIFKPILPGMLLDKVNKLIRV